MKKRLSVILAAVLMLALSFTFVACGEQGSKYTITFDSMGGSDVAAITAAAGEQVTAPADPTKDGYEFLGWFESSDGGATLSETEFTVAYMPSKNVTVYAKWVALSVENKTYKQTEFIVKWESEEAKAKCFEEMGSGDESITEEEFLNLYNGMNMQVVFSNDRFSVSAPGSPGGYSKSDLFYSIAENGVISVYLTAEDKEAGTEYKGDGIFMNTFVVSKDYKTVRLESPLPGTTECAIVLSVAK